MHFSLGENDLNFLNQSASNLRIINPRSRPYLEMDICSDTIGIWKIFFFSSLTAVLVCNLKRHLKLILTKNTTLAPDLGLNMAPTGP
jgi:hypothetical protein